MRRRLQRILIATVVAAVLVFLWFGTDRTRRKFLIGAARILTQEVPIRVEADGLPAEGVRCFRESTRFDGGPSSRLVLWIANEESHLGRDILIIDPQEKLVLLPNASEHSYRLLWGRWLLQSDSGALGVPFGDPKLHEGDPDFQQRGNRYAFTIPPILDLRSGRWHVEVVSTEESGS